MSNLERLSAAGVIAPNARLVAGEIAIIESMSELEITSLISANMQVRDQADDAPVPTFHVSI